MGRPRDTQILQTLIGLKKQRAEQRMAKVRLDQQTVDLEVQSIQQDLCPCRDMSENFDALKAAAINGFSERIAQRLAILHDKRLRLAAEMATAEHEMKVALHAERELSGANR